MSEEYLPSEQLIKYYNILNSIGNHTQYPWDLDEKITYEDFIPTYKNITLYYKDSNKLLNTKLSKNNNKPKKGGSESKTLVFFI
jgi:hypothetical protein